MDDFFSFRGTIFAKLLELDLTSHSDVYSYLDSMQSMDDYNKLKLFSEKLKQIENLEWLNAKAETLNGKLVLIDFWTYCCINCMHLIPLLNQLETEFEQLSIIGIHSSKFTNEKSKTNILHAIRRHLIKHPVVNDSDLIIWNEMQISCWPTLLIIDPNGLVIAEFIGETQANLAKQFLTICFKYYKDQITNKKFAQSFDRVDSVSVNKISFPTKMCLDPSETTVYISDSGNNRILCVDYTTNNVKQTIGSSKSGHLDSSFETAQFDWPQGLALDSNKLYIADTFNNLIRCADLTTGTVSTLCGVLHSDQIGYYDLIGGRQALEQTISSPWDLCILNKENSKVLLIACAGTHQIWLYSFKNDSIAQEFNLNELLWWKGLKFNWGTLSNIVGNGKERNKNNSYPLQASFAQPSGINQHCDSVYIADAESSTIRVLSLKDGSVKNIAGGDQLQPDDLFAYGDRDGKGAEARLQHPLDVKYFQQNENEYLLIADTYNHALKLIDLKTKMCRKLNLIGRLNEPNGLCIDCKTMNVFISDTNNNCVKLIRDFNIMSSELQLEDFNIIGLTQQIENLSLKNDILIKFNYEINLEAVTNWNLLIKTKNGLQIERLGNKITRLMNQLYKLESTDLDLETLDEIVLDLSVVYCEHSNSIGDICKIFKKNQLLFTRENWRSSADSIILEIKI